MKKFVAPVAKPKDGTDGSVSDEGKTSAAKKFEDLEVYEVMYTKHVNQNLKTWEEGIF